MAHIFKHQDQSDERLPLNFQPMRVTISNEPRSASRYRTDAGLRLFLTLFCCATMLLGGVVIAHVNEQRQVISDWFYHLSFNQPSASATNIQMGSATSGREVMFDSNTRLKHAIHLPSDSPTVRSFETLETITSVQSNESGLKVLLRCKQSSTRFAVMTSISSHPTAAQISLTMLNEPWCVIVIGDEKGPEKDEYYSDANIELGVREYQDIMRHELQKVPLFDDFPIKRDVITSRIAYLDIQEQALLPYSLLKLTSYGSFSRKNLGFLLAMHVGATVILDVDDDNVYIPNLSEDGFKDLPIDLDTFEYESSLPFHSTLLTHVKTNDIVKSLNMSYFNPYPLYGVKDAWPRGFPLRAIKDSIAPILMCEEQTCTRESIKCNAVIQQYLASHDPDVDAIYRLTNSRSLPFDFNHRSIKYALAPNVYAPFNAQATIVMPGAFMLMLLPSSVHGRVSDIWRSYIMETLFSYYQMNQITRTYEMNTPLQGNHTEDDHVPVCMVFTPPYIYHDRNKHNYQLDFNSEIPLYMEAEAFTTWLSERMCGNEKDLAARFLPFTNKKSNVISILGDLLVLLYAEMSESNILKSSDFIYAQAWVHDVLQILN